MKTLYFEGAGIEGTGGASVGNCRIRTAFHLDNGERIYLELMGTEVTLGNSKKLRDKFNHLGYVACCHYITDDKENDDENKHRIPYKGVEWEYTRENILKFVNNLGASFDAIEVLPHLAGYRAFSGYKDGALQYNYGDEFTPNIEAILRAKIVHNHFYELEKSEGKKYPNFSLWVDDNSLTKLHLLRHFNGYNKHWEIDVSTDEWEASIKETELGKYGC